MLSTFLSRWELSILLRGDDGFFFRFAAAAAAAAAFPVFDRV